jgi:hypothetical protein
LLIAFTTWDNVLIIFMAVIYVEAKYAVVASMPMLPKNTQVTSLVYLSAVVSYNCKLLMTFALWPNNMNLFKTVIYVSCCMIPTRILQQSAIAWIAMAVIYNHKLFMTLTLGVRVLYLFTAVIYVVTASAGSVCIG